MAGDYRTDDMAKATVLALAGFEYTMIKLTERKVLWVFMCPDEKQDDFDDQIDAYDEWKASVEPRQFILRFNEMRHELFTKLNGVSHRRRSGSPAADFA